jgi:hypothetical protein
MDDIVYLECSEIKEEFKCFLIETTINKLTKNHKGVADDSFEDVMAIYIGSSSFLQRYTKEKLVELHNRDDANWKNWCDDVMLFYISRNILFNKPIPVKNTNGLIKLIYNTSRIPIAVLVVTNSPVIESM